jgi:preprotein translocase subunit SecA
MPIESGWVTKAIENAQTKVEGYNFDIRKHVVEYDDVMNQHRDVIYGERRKILEGADIKANILDMVHEEIAGLVDGLLTARREQEWDLEGLLNEVNGIVRLPPAFTVEAFEALSRDEILERLLAFADEAYEAKEQAIGAENMRLLERLVLLRTIDSLWVEHLTAMDEMRQGIGLQAYGQTDPLVAYKREAHDMWEQLLANIRRQVARTIYLVELAPAVAPARPAAPVNLRENRTDGAANGSRPAGAVKKVGRNEPCPCGSGRKYKKCHGAAVGV